MAVCGASAEIMSRFTYYDFFAGGGLVQQGLGPKWSCLLANDNDPKKASTFKANWGDDHLQVCDVQDLNITNFPEKTVDLSWASFPCQDLSLAGGRSGLRGKRSGTFWPYWELMRRLNLEGRAPKLIALENVYGALRSHEGKDFEAIVDALSQEGYRFGAIVADAIRFVPQSRPRLFILGVRADLHIPAPLIKDYLDPLWHPPAIQQAFKGLPRSLQEDWMWIQLPSPDKRKLKLSDVLEDDSEVHYWHTSEETNRLIGMMTEVNLIKVRDAIASKQRTIGCLYRRTRGGVQRAEVRFDNVAGCLRTPTGGSSRLTIVTVESDKVRSRLLTAREAARLMGLKDNYVLPENYNEAYHLAGDGVVTTVVSHLASNFFEVVLDENAKARRAA